MRSFRLAVAALVLCVGSYAGISRAESTPLVKNTYKSVALLYAQTEDGGQRMYCTATAFEKVADGYLFATAAHCVANDDTQHERVQVDKAPLYITFDEAGEKKFKRATLIAAGYQHRGDDFAILHVKTDEVWAVTPLGDEAKEDAGAEIVNVASPQGLGRQVFHGWITMLKIDRPIRQSDINWTNAMLLQVESGPGSSGSAIVSVVQGAIIGFLVGHYEQNIFAVPVSQFKAFRAAVTAGKYKWYVPEETK